MAIAPTSISRLEVRNVSKTFASTRVLTKVDLRVGAGEVHGLVGQNGSGKSTLIKILTGIYAPDPGAEYVVDRTRLRLPARWREVHKAGVSVVHQDLGLLDHLSVAENVCVGGYPTVRHMMHRLDRKEMVRLTERTLDRLEVKIDAHRSVGTLSAPERAEVAIARAMRDQVPGSGLVILDESTRALAGDDLARIHRLLHRIVGEGGSVLLVSHNLAELMAVAHRATVLRDGCAAASGVSTTELTEQRLAKLMLGRDGGAAVERRGLKLETGSFSPAQSRAVVADLSGEQVTDVGFSVESGEIVGLTGLPGSGYEEIPGLVAGSGRVAAGRLAIAGRSIDLRSARVRDCIRAGVALVPERRERDGLAFALSVRDNIALPALRERGRPWFVSRAWQRREAWAATTSLGIRPANPSMLVKQLSGGNQQKVLLAKWLTLSPRLLILHEPTQAVDVGARVDVLRAVQRAADGGMSVLLVSSEPEDLVGACDRVLIYTSGSGLRESEARTAPDLIDDIYGSTSRGDEAIR